MNRDEGRLYAIVGGVEARIAAALDAGVVARIDRIETEGGLALWDHLMGVSEVPASWDVDVFGIGTLPDLVDLAQDTNGPLEALTGVLGRARKDVERLLAARNPADLLAWAREVLDGPARGVLEGVAPFIAGQVGVVVSLVTSLRKLASPNAAHEVRDAALKYFFTEGGYQTVEGGRLVSPIQVLRTSDRIADAFSARTAEFYVRDLIRLLVEAADDVRYGLKARYTDVGATVKDKKDKFDRWFKGISALAESTVMSSVEQTALGAGAFQSNSLIAATVSTFAGTAARKAAQHVFLRELGG